MKKLSKEENGVGVVVKLIAFILFSVILIYGLVGAFSAERGSPSLRGASDSTTGVNASYDLCSG